jgi:hypothetical protein
MNARQITLPFRLRPAEPRNANRDLIGRSYFQDRYITVTVIGICFDDDARVMVRRNLDGRTWTMPGWLVRLILLEERKRAA